MNLICSKNYRLNNKGLHRLYKYKLVHAYSSRDKQFLLESRYRNVIHFSDFRFSIKIKMRITDTTEVISFCEFFFQFNFYCYLFFSFFKKKKKKRKVRYSSYVLFFTLTRKTKTKYKEKACMITPQKGFNKHSFSHIYYLCN